MIKPVLQDQKFLDDVTQAAELDRLLHLWWLGQSGYLIHWQGAHLLVDPYLSNSLTRKYAGTEKPHVRMTERVIAPERLDFIDVATSSHNHSDHLDSETLIPLMSNNPYISVIVSQANREFAAKRLGVSPGRLTGITLDQTVEIDPFTFHAVPAAHEKLETDEDGEYHYIGYVIQAGPWVLYHSGDTLRFPGMAGDLRKWHIDIGLLPINGRDPKRRVAGNLNAAEAAQLARDAKIRCAIPCHYEMFEFNTASPQDFAQAAESLSQPFRILKCGQRASFGDL